MCNAKPAAALPSAQHYHDSFLKAIRVETHPSDYWHSKLTALTWWLATC